MTREAILQLLHRVQRQQEAEGVSTLALDEAQGQQALLGISLSSCFNLNQYNFLIFFVWCFVNVPFAFQALHTMRLGARFHQRGWQLMGEGLQMMSAAVLGTDTQELWNVFESMFGMIDVAKEYDNASVASSSVSHHSKKMA